MENTKVQRRTLVKGAAWAAPVVVAASSVPAYAASLCPGNIVPSRTYDSGLLSMEQLSSGFIMNSLGTGDAILTGLPSDVTVTQLEMSLIFKTRDSDSQQGLPALNQASETSGNNNIPADPDYRIAIKNDSTKDNRENAEFWASAAPSSTASSTVTYWDYVKNDSATATITRDLQIEHPDGKTYNSWKIDYPVWKSSSPDSYRAFNYKETADGCRTFTMTDFGKMQAVYNNAAVPYYTLDSTGNVEQNNFNAFLRHRYTLSNGTVLIYDSWRTSYSPYLPESEERIH